jgi:hypothetical protein
MIQFIDIIKLILNVDHGVKRGRRPQINQSFFLILDLEHQVIFNFFCLKYLNMGKYRMTKVKLEGLGENFIFLNFLIKCFSINTK